MAGPQFRNRRLHLRALVPFLVFLTTPCGVASAQGDTPLGLKPVAQGDRVATTVTSEILSLAGHRPIWARPENLAGNLSDGTEVLRIAVLLRLSPAAEQAMEDLLASQQNPGSSLYHQAVSPTTQGVLFGPTEHDVEAVKRWAETQGLIFDSLSPSRTQLFLRAPASQVAAALHTHFSLYRTVRGLRRAPDSEPQVPAALGPVIAGIAGLTPDDAQPGVTSLPAHAETPAVRAKAANMQPLNTAQPLFSGSKGNYFITPADFATIYDVAPVYAASNTGATIGTLAQHVAIAAGSDANPDDVQAFAVGVGLGNYRFNTFYANGIDPGLTSNQGEAELDLERVLGTAQGVTADLVVGNSGNSIYDAAYYAVNTLNDPIVTVSFGLCEPSLGQANTLKWADLWRTAAASMISAFVSGGDAGAAACDPHDAAPPAGPQQLAINGFSSSPYNTSVGGTEFADAGNYAQFWSSKNDAGTKASALGYIPEGAWNDPSRTDPATGLTSVSVNGGGGGASLYNPKPSWQTGTGVPADAARDTPDISFSGSYFHDRYYFCGPGECTVAAQSNPATFVAFGNGGTSATAPTMAGLAALLNSAAGARQGLLNPMIYRLASSPVASLVFHDVTVPSSGVANCDIDVPSMCNNSTPSNTPGVVGQAGYLLTPGYDQATGWGSLDVAHFLRAAVPVATSVQETVTGSALSFGQTIMATATLKPAAASLAVPTGTVQFSINNVPTGAPVSLTNNVAASAPLSFSAAGSYTLTAAYSGDVLYLPSTSTAASVAVSAQGPGLTLTPSHSTLTFLSGATTGNSEDVTVSSLNNYVGAVNLACSVSASGAAFQPFCTLSSPTAALAVNGSATVTISISSTTAQALFRTPVSPDSRSPLPGHAGEWGLALTSFGLLSFRRRLKGSRWVLASVVLIPILFGTLTGCSGSRGPAVTRSSAGSYTVTVTANGTGAGALASSTGNATFAVVIQ